MRVKYRLHLYDMSKVKRFLKITTIYFVGNILSKLLAFFLIPIYTTYISTEVYGTYDLIMSIISLVIPIVFFQIWDGVFRFIYDYKKDEDKYKIINNGIIVSLIGIIIYEIIFLITSSIIDIPANWIVNIYGITFAGQYLFGTFARTLKKNKLYMITGIINTLINLLINIILIIGFKMNSIETLFISIVVGNIVQCIIILYKLKIMKYFNLKDISKELIVKMIKFSMPIAISTISYWLLSGYTKVYIGNNLGLASNGIFGMASRLASFVVLVVSVLQMAWHEISFEMADDKEKNKFYNKGLSCFMILLSIATFYIIGVIKIVFPILIKGDYIQAEGIIPIVVSYTTINAFAGFCSTQFLAEKNSKVPLYTTLIAGIVNIILVHILSKEFDIMGASIALLISFSINTILRMIYLDKKYKIKMNFCYVIISAVLLILSALFYYFVNIFIYLLFGLILLALIFIFRNRIIDIIKGGNNEKNSGNDMV